VKAHKLVRLHDNGEISSLFIGNDQPIKRGIWLEAEWIKTKGFAFRPGWHCCLTPHAPHLSMDGRVWVEVEIENYELYSRPDSQGGAWLLAQDIKFSV
jgi:hypothetical protein